ncbi:hypothetical protein [Thioclava indica]|uniref:DUF218 domain-containing protein n=1 Tax=Thioclava indica TaxID=1353528 RepID=A0A074JMJ3_9RHOB|nr:hypothetical protein [Thioclava indica]KEO57105.1 hypothetical protein DT23_17200 [Thioclava indica]
MIGNLEFVFVHSYSSKAENWAQVMLGDDSNSGRLTRAIALAEELKLPLLANDALDDENARLFASHEIPNLGTARNTADEVRLALEYSDRRAILFVSSPDHLPRVVRDALVLRGNSCVFASSDVPFSETGVEAVEVREPAHLK